MIRLAVTILLILTSLITNAQSDEEKLKATIKEFHQALVAKKTISINEQTDKALSYGHSSGWVETKTEFLKNLESGFMVYQQFREDSLDITSNGVMANARFIAEISGIRNGVAGKYQLRVLEVWVKKGNRWLLFARQAVKRV